MKRWDMHCDVLSKMILDQSIRFDEDARLDVTCKRLKAGEVQLQAFAIYIPEDWIGNPFDAVLSSIDAFRQRVVNHPEIIHIRTKSDLDRLLRPGEKSIGAMLTLEGADGLEGNMTYLRTVFELGVRTLGITWNNANWAADGVGEIRGGGFTNKGKRFIKECDRLGLPLDISHLSEKAFWELRELSDQPVIASHSNAKAICKHQRNLTDEQVRAIIAAKGRIGIAFVPFFLRDTGGPATIDDVLRHVEHMCALGGESIVGFGSDFDGISEWVKGLEHPGCFGKLENELLKRYSSTQVEGFIRENWLSYYKEVLPEEGGDID